MKEEKKKRRNPSAFMNGAPCKEKEKGNKCECPSGFSGNYCKKAEKY